MKANHYCFEFERVPAFYQLRKIKDPFGNLQVLLDSSLNVVC